MFAHRFGKPVRRRVGIVGLECDQRRGAYREVVEINLRNILCKSRRSLGNDAECPGAGRETKRGQRRLAPTGVVQVGGGTEEGNPRLVHSGGSDGLIVADNEFLRAVRRYRRETWHACAATGQGAVHGRVVKVIIEGPVACLTTVEVDAFSNFIVSNRIPLAIVRVCAIAVISSRDVGENSNRGFRPCIFGNEAAWKDAFRRRATACKAVLLTVCDGIPQAICKHRRPVEAGRRGRRGTTAGGTGTAIDRTGQGCRIKLAAKFGCTRRGNAADFRALHLPGPLIIREPEQLVFPEWASRGKTELMPVQ